MPTPAVTSHRLLEKLIVSYAPYLSPIDDTPHIREGINTLTSMRGVINRRPGFATTVEPAPTQFPGRIANIFTWRKMNLNFFVMVNHIHNGNSEVWKLELGVDSSFVRILEQVGTITPFDFIAQNNHVYYGNAHPGAMWKYNGTLQSKWGIDAPTVKPQCFLADNGTSSITGEADYHYRYTYYSNISGHESSPSEINDCLQPFTNKAVQIVVRASLDTVQVSHIRIYRTRDGGSTDPRDMQEISASPIGNEDATVTDWTEDADLRNRFCPGLKRNDPPPPLRGFVSHGSRIFGFVRDQVWWSGFDEITNGVQEECFPSGQSGNFWPFGDEIGALAEMGGDVSGVAVFMPSRIAKIDGELRNEMRRYTLDLFHGARQPRAAASTGGEAAWFDVASQLRLSSVGDVSEDVRNRLESYNADRTMVVPHVSKRRNWLCVLDTISGELLTFDGDTGMWQTPWPSGATAIHSGEIASGNRVLLAAIDNTVYYMTEGKFNDAGTPYAAHLRTSLVPLAPKSNPDLVMALDSVSIERDENDIADIKIALDELPELAGNYASIKANEGDPTYRPKMVSLIERRYTVPPETGVAKRATIWLEWPAVDKDFELYAINAEMHPPETIK